MMDFDTLPADIFQKIFQDLSLKEQVRIGRVNKRLQEISQLIISKWKSINLNQKQFQRFNVCSLSNLLQLCSPNLKEFESDNDDGWPLATFLKFTYPKLIKLSICTKDRYKLFDELIRKNQNIQSLKLWDRCEYSMRFPPDITFNNLTSLEIYRGNIEIFRSLTWRCLKLKSFKIYKLITPISDYRIFDNFFASCPELSTFEIEEDFASRFLYSISFVHFWQLKQMRYLKIRWIGEAARFQDEDIKKIAASFPRLESLWLQGGDVTNDGMIALSSLSDLKHLKLILFNVERRMRNFDFSIQLLARCEHLESLELPTFFDITSSTLMTLFEHCRKLKTFTINNITNVETTDVAIAMFHSLSNIIEQDISITTIRRRSVWESYKVTNKLRKLRKNGCAINFNLPLKK